MFRSFLVAVLAAALSPAAAFACACGCGVFDVGTSAMLPTKPGGLAFLEYDFMDQKQDWGQGRKSPAESNDDKRLQSDFITAGVHEMFNRSWGVMAELPYEHRYFNTADDDGSVGGFKHSAVGDIRVRGVYSGFSADMSGGLTFGLKLPTGDYGYPGLDRDTSIGSGSTDLLLGAYKMGRLGASPWAWYANGRWDQPVLISGGYRPGEEVDALAGVYYDGWKPAGITLAPLAQAVVSWRARDTGTFANYDNSGYRRLLLAPGVELDGAGWRASANVGFPVAQYVNGDQIVAAQYWQAMVGRKF
jgi:hypothetical protein